MKITYGNRNNDIQILHSGFGATKLGVSDSKSTIPPRDVSVHLSYLCQYSSGKTFCSWDQELPTPSQENHTYVLTCTLLKLTFDPVRPMMFIFMEADHGIVSLFFGRCT